MNPVIVSDPEGLIGSSNLETFDTTEYACAAAGFWGAPCMDNCNAYARTQIMIKCQTIWNVARKMQCFNCYRISWTRKCNAGEIPECPEDDVACIQNSNQSST